MPIAGILDTTTTAGPATPSAAGDLGIAKNLKCKLFSDDTILKDYAYPNITQMELTQEAGPDGPEPRSYLRKSFAPGPIGYRAAVSTSLIDKLPVNFPTQQLELDDNVMADYGGLLFPRAIGFWAGLIDYFFRGNIQTDVGAVFQSTPDSSPPTTVTMYNVSNLTPDEETGNGGTLTLVLKLTAEFNTAERDCGEYHIEPNDRERKSLACKHHIRIQLAPVSLDNGSRVFSSRQLYLRQLRSF